VIPLFTDRGTHDCILRLSFFLVQITRSERREYSSVCTVGTVSINRSIFPSLVGLMHWSYRRRRWQGVALPLLPTWLSDGDEWRWLDGAVAVSNRRLQTEFRCERNVTRERLWEKNLTIITVLRGREKYFLPIPTSSSEDLCGEKKSEFLIINCCWESTF